MQTTNIQTSSHGKKIFITLLVIVAIITASLSALWLVPLVLPSSTTSAPPTPTYTVHRSDEVPGVLHRLYSTSPVEVSTSAMPWGITLDPVHGYVWVAEPGCEPLPKCTSPSPGTIGQYAYSDGSFIQDFPVPADFTGPLFLAVTDNGNLYFTQPNSDAIGMLDPVKDSWKQWHTQKGATPYDLLLDSNGNLWFTEFSSNAIGFLHPETGALVETVVPTADASPYGITRDKNGTIWFTENRNGLGQIASFTPSTSGTIKITEHAVNALRPHLITSDKDGNIWYSDGFTGRVGKYTPANDASVLYSVYPGICANPLNCSGTHISGIVADTKGNIWFSDSLSQRVGFLIPSSGQIVIQTLTNTNAHPHDGLILDNNGRVWYTEQNILRLAMQPQNAFH